MKRFAIQLAALLAATAIASTAGAQNGAMHFEFPLITDPDAPNMYAACIDDGIAIDATVYATSQFVLTPDGNVHVVDNWRIEGTATGQETGWNWFVHGASPFTTNAQGQQFAGAVGVNLMLEPLDGGPRLRSRERIRLVVNANGDVQVSVLEVEWRCLGQPD